MGNLKDLLEKGAPPEPHLNDNPGPMQQQVEVLFQDMRNGMGREPTLGELAAYFGWMLDMRDWATEMSAYNRALKMMTDSDLASGKRIVQLS